MKNKGLCGILDMNRKKRICLVEGENEMCEKVDQLARQREQEAVLMTLFRGVEAQKAPGDVLPVLLRPL